MQLEEDLKVLRNEVMRSGETGIQLPVNFRRLIWNAQQIFKCRPHRPGASGVSTHAHALQRGLLEGESHNLTVAGTGMGTSTQTPACVMGHPQVSQGISQCCVKATRRAC